MKIILLVAAFVGVAYFILRSKKSNPNKGGSGSSGGYDSGYDEISR